MAKRDEKLGYYNYHIPLYAVFHEDDETFSLMWSEYDDAFPLFHNTCLSDKEKYGKNKGILAKKDLVPPENAYTVSTLPWVSFKSFSLNSTSPTPYFFPSVESGKIGKERGRLILPLSLTLHHGTTDGWHLKELLERIQEDADNFERFA